LRSRKVELAADLFEDAATGLIGGEFGIVDDGGAEGDHEGGGGALAVALVAVGQVVLDALGGTAFGAFVQ